ncbi:hypothetical protein ACFX15_038163 [Malus domestica]
MRFSRPKRMKEYTGYVENMENGLVDCGESTRTDCKRFGFSKPFGEAYGSSLVLSLCKSYKPYVESGHVVLLDEQSAADEFNPLLVNKTRLKEVPAYIRLSDPDGFLLSNELISLAFAVVAP